MPKLSTSLEQINSLQRRYRKALSGRFFLLSKLFSADVVEIVYHSHSLKGAEISYEKIERILQDQDTRRLFSHSELAEIDNLAELLNAMGEEESQNEIDFGKMTEMHKILMKGLDEKSLGRFRENKERARVKTDVDDYTAPSPTKMRALLEDALIDYYCSHCDGIVKRLARFHLAFAHARPFTDGNGRVARSAVNYLLICDRFPPIIFRKHEQEKYEAAFKEFNKKGVTKKMEEIIADALINSLFKRLAYLENKKIVTLTDYARSKKLSPSALINKARRHTIEAFLERDVWKIGVGK